MVAGAGVDRGVFNILLAGGGVFDNLLAGSEGFAASLVLIVSNTYIAENKFIAKWSINQKKLVKKYSQVRRPGIEPGAKQWECSILPLNYLRVRSINFNSFTLDIL